MENEWAELTQKRAEDVFRRFGGLVRHCWLAFRLGVGLPPGKQILPESAALSSHFELCKRYAKST